MPQPANIRKLYADAGLLNKMPEGKGINTPAFHMCVIGYLKKRFSFDEAAQRCMGALGRNAAVNKSHWSPTYKQTRKEIKKQYGT